jgi:ABC-type glycerol-3-phosphate transport system substrate-binding protein
MTRTVRLRRLSVALAVVACSGCAPAAPAVSTPVSSTAKPAASQSQWYEAARKEGAVIVYGIGDDAFVPLKKGFEARYAGITAEGLDQSGQQTREKIIAESAARQVKADVASAAGTSFSDMVKSGVIEVYGSPEAAQLVPDLIDPRGSGSGGTILYGLEKVFGPEFVQQLATQDIFFVPRDYSEAGTQAELDRMQTWAKLFCGN